MDNQTKIEEAKQRLGDKYLLHPDNKVTRITPPKVKVIYVPGEGLVKVAA